MILLVVCAVSCTKHDERAYVDLNIGYEVNGEALATDTLCYTNEAGNPFLITEIQRFLSNVQLLNQEGEWHTMLQREAIDSVAELTEHIFYIDTDIPESQVLHGKKIPVGHYTALRSLSASMKPTMKRGCTMTRQSRTCSGPTCWAVATTI